MTVFKSFVPVFLLIVTVLSCKGVDPEKGGNGENGGNGDNSKIGAPIEVVDGKVRFFITAAAETSAVRDAMGLKADDFTGFKVNVNGSDYMLQKDTGGNWYIDVTAVNNNVYNAVLVTRNSQKWYGSSAFKDVAVPFSQFFSATRASFKDYPRYASYSESTGNLLAFSDAVSILKLVITGEGSLCSVKVRALGGDNIAGLAVFQPSKGNLNITTGLDQAVVNCTENGKFVKLGGAPVTVPVILNQSSLRQGMELTICDSNHRMMRKTITPGAIKPGTVVTENVSYSPESDIVWYEGFDNFVWGGDIMGGSGSTGFSPDASKIGISDGTGRDGYADAFKAVEYNNPGTGFIQSNTWDEVNGIGVATSHVMSESYIDSRNIRDWFYLFRCQEYHGILAIGCGNQGRGIMQTPPIGNLQGITDATISFNFCFMAGATDDMLVQVINAGYITSCKIDGSPVDFKQNYSANASVKIVGHKSVTIPAESASKTWHNIELTLTNATDGTRLYIAGNDSGSGVHGIYIDDITVRSLPGTGRKGNLRLLYWNIQNGMWSDQANNYDNFVAFVRKYDPDICVWCEASSIYKDNTSTSESTSNRFLPSGWAALAARYGHNYSALGGFRDNYPQEVTSKYPITTLLKITDSNVSGKPIAHGAAIQQVNVNGRLLNLVTCHMWPQAYGYGVATANRDASAARNEGDYYREFEMEYIVAQTINNSKYSSVSDWMLLGDMNSRSRKDNWYYGYPENDTRLLTQDVVLNKTQLKDVIAECYPAPDNLVSSTGGTARIDYVYVSSGLMDKVVNALILGDKWVYPVKSKFVSSFYDPSDHRPILVDFDLTK